METHKSPSANGALLLAATYLGGALLLIGFHLLFKCFPNMVPHLAKELYHNRLDCVSKVVITIKIFYDNVSVKSSPISTKSHSLAIFHQLTSALKNHMHGPSLYQPTSSFKRPREIVPHYTKF